eukprot:Tbor_TRINITY_DN2811_c0_g1::TRINITY_DN2811_c0_g1_i1::g.23247::m.23247/K16747/BBS2; Bardet-Biedl syndrome 2 protein
MPVDIKLGAAFEFHFGNPIVENMSTIGKFDGKHCSLACATVGGRIMVHSARLNEDASAVGDSASPSDITFLNFNRVPTALLAAPVDSSRKEDLLIIGSQTSITAYDVNKNSDAYFKDVQEAVRSVSFGSINTALPKMAIVGGNCSITGFDKNGNELFWTVTGDVVTALGCGRWNAGAMPVLLAGSEDFSIRAFSGEEVIASITESDRIKTIHMMDSVRSPGRFAVSLGNGTVAMYVENQRQWRFKTKHQNTALGSCDVDLDGVEEVLCGWSNGKFDVRADGCDNGGVPIFKETFSTPVNSIQTADYRQNGRLTPVVCTYDGTVRGFVAMETNMNEAVDARDRGLLEELMAKKHKLQFDITNMEKQISVLRKGEGQAANMPSIGAIVSAMLRPNAQQKCIDLVLKASEGVISSATILGEQTFGKNDSAFYFSDNPSSILACPISTCQDIPADLRISANVGMTSTGEVFQVHDISLKLPKFAMYIPVREILRKPSGYVTGPLRERVTRFQLWVHNNFNVPVMDVEHTYSGNFVSVRDGSSVQISAKSTDNGGTFIIYCDDMGTCGEMVQSLAAFLGISEMKTTSDFPKEFEALNSLFEKVEEYSAIRTKLTAEMADSAHYVKALIVKAEDARIQCEMAQMKKMYSCLYDTNKALFGEYMKRSNNHIELLEVLKKVNETIEKGSKLRVGAAKSDTVTKCREALKDKNTALFIKIIKGTQ